MCLLSRNRETIGAVRDDLLEGARGEKLINSGVIPFGRKLVKNWNVWTTSRHTQRVMKSLPSLFPLLPTPNESAPK